MFFIVGVPSSWVKQGGVRISPPKNGYARLLEIFGDSSMISTKNCDVCLGFSHTLGSLVDLKSMRNVILVSFFCLLCRLIVGGKVVDMKWKDILTRLDLAILSFSNLIFAGILASSHLSKGFTLFFFQVC